MKLAEYASLDGVGLHHLIASGQVSAAEAVSAALRAIEAVNPRINALAEYWPAEEGAAASAEGNDSPLSGVPFLIKDLGVAMKGRRSEMGSRLAEGLVAREDSNLMGRFRKAGLLTLGRTTMPELAVSTTTEGRLCGPTRNPWRLVHGAGGSSGGAAAAVAAGIVPLAHATDGGGSIRVPASCNGLFGMKPTRGRVSNGPAVDEVWNGLGINFAVSRSVRDSAALLDAVNGGGIGEPYTIAPPANSYLSEIRQCPGRLRIGFTVHWLEAVRTAPVVSQAFAGVVRHLESLGHHVEEVSPDLGTSWDSFVHANAQIWTANAAMRINALSSATGRPVTADILEPATFAVYEYGRRVSATDLLGALQVRNAVTRALGGFFQHYDILLTPTLPDLPPRLGEYNKDEQAMDGYGWIGHVLRQSPFTAWANVAGLPAMSVPLSFDAETGLPIGTQFAAGFGREDILFRLAAQLEASLPWGGRHPPVWAGNDCKS
ncbi:amidase [Noviherbaspirillum sp.]|uniref:amidase n=1 Tax=Noviherbaspirillum sp. TaxID=1926288 RepID=UPI002D424C30|nr:amidase [Noviherbaspirillum sp.]HZW20854.1 amidase [Noviherbaspirillum sp.]